MRASLMPPTALALVGLTACTSQEPVATFSAEPTGPTVSSPAPSPSLTPSGTPRKPASFRVVRTLDSASAPSGKYIARARIAGSGPDGRAVYDVAEWKG